MTNTSYSYKEIYPSVVLTSDDIKSSKHSVNDASSGCCDGCASTDGIEEMYMRTNNMHNIKAFVIQTGRILLCTGSNFEYTAVMFSPLSFCCHLLFPPLPKSVNQIHSLYRVVLLKVVGVCTYIYLNLVFLLSTYGAFTFFVDFILSCSFVSKNEVGQLWFVLE